MNVLHLKSVTFTTRITAVSVRLKTPEGPNIGLISNLTTYARVNEYGFIQTPYRKVTPDGEVTEEYIYLSADEEADYTIAQANECINGHLVNEQVVARIAGETVLVPKEEVELADVSPKQIISIAAGCIPFLENDDASRALMGAKHAASGRTSTESTFSICRYWY